MEEIDKKVLLEHNNLKNVEHTVYKALPLYTSHVSLEHVSQYTEHCHLHLH